jgi:hypothetical protein
LSAKAPHYSSHTFVLIYKSSKVAIVHAAIAATAAAAAHLDSVVSCRGHACSDPHWPIVSA